jgi:hypothetical protein
MIEYQRAGKTWKFSPLPANKTTVTLYCGMAELGKKKEGQKVDVQLMMTVIKALPESIERSMRDHHSEREINAFIDTVVLDFGDPESMKVLGDLNALFLGVSPDAIKKTAGNEPAES